jgi:hypothetical protein
MIIPMKYTLIVLAALALASGADADKHFHHCTFVGGSGNSPHLFDVSEVYACDEGKVEIAGQTTQTIEYGHIYTSDLGRIRMEPRAVSDFDLKSLKWCSTPTAWDKNQKERCGDKPVTCFDGKIATWDAGWQGYSCATPDHQGKVSK